jgi:competence protein ComEC
VGALVQSWSPTWAVSAIAVLAAVIWRNKRRLAVLLIAIVLGATNTYGHPAPSTISALTQLGAKVLRTDIDGAVAIRAASHQFSLQRSKRWFRFFSWS